MGCDIHTHLERRKGFDPSLERDIDRCLEEGDRPGVMRRLREMRELPLVEWEYITPEMAASTTIPFWPLSRIEEQEPSEEVVEEVALYYDHGREIVVRRNYWLFTIMAGVRAGRDTPLNVISPPRGLPPDVTQQVWRYSQAMGADGHSHSWLSVKDLLEYPHWDGPLPEGWTASPGEDTLRKACSEITNLFPEFLKLGNPEDLRLVFWFDN